jgi:hypothetical protein
MAFNYQLSKSTVEPPSEFNMFADDALEWCYNDKEEKFKERVEKKFVDHMPYDV